MGRKVPAQVSPSICSFADTLAAQSLGVVARHRPAQPKWHNHFLSRTKPLPLGPDAALRQRDLVRGKPDGPRATARAGCASPGDDKGGKGKGPQSALVTEDRAKGVWRTHGVTPVPRPAELVPPFRPGPFGAREAAPGRGGGRAFPRTGPSRPHGPAQTPAGASGVAALGKPVASGGMMRTAPGRSVQSAVRHLPGRGRGGHSRHRQKAIGPSGAGRAATGRRRPSRRFRDPPSCAGPGGYWR